MTCNTLGFNKLDSQAYQDTNSLIRQKLRSENNKSLGGIVRIDASYNKQYRYHLLYL